MSEEGKPAAAQTPPSPQATPAKPVPPQPAKPAPAQSASPNLPTERKYIEVKVGDYVEFKVRRPDGDVWRIGRVTSLNRDFTDIMPIDSERIYCTHKEFIRRVLAAEEVSALPPPVNWYLERE